MWRNLASNMLTLLIVGLVAVVVAIGWAQWQYVAEGPLEEAICLRVPKGGFVKSVIVTTQCAIMINKAGFQAFRHVDPRILR